MKKAIIQAGLSVVGVLLFLNGFGDNYKGFTKSPGGLYYKLYQMKLDTVKPRTGDWISLNMRYSTKIKGKDSLLFESKVMLKGAPLRFQLPPNDFKGDLYEGIQMLSPGDSAEFIINADSLFVKTFKMKERPAMIDSNSVIFFFVHLLSVDAPDKMKRNEEVTLKNYIEANKITEKPTLSGVYIVVKEQGEGARIDSGSMVKLHFSVSLIDEKILFSSFDRPEPLKFQYGQKFDTPGLEEAIGTLKKGAKAKVIVPSSMAFGEMGKGSLVPPYATLIYNIDVVDVQSKADYEKEMAEEKQQEQMKIDSAKKAEYFLRENYLKAHNVTVKPTTDGLYYIEKVKGTGKQPIKGNKVRVLYTGTLLDGKQFDSSVDKNDPYEFTLGTGQVIKGWDEGIAMMKQGGKATLIIPSAIAFGDRVNGEITPYSTLVFDVELLEVIDTTPPPVLPEKK
jgi:FKBP-type peptidyl-prolyl cis-trans isomerase